MNIIQNTTLVVQDATRVLVVTGTAIALTALPAAARQDPGPMVTPAPVANAHFCAPERVGTQYVACDNLTGNGVPAPTWVHER